MAIYHKIDQEMNGGRNLHLKGMYYLPRKKMNTVPSPLNYQIIYSYIPQKWVDPTHVAMGSLWYFHIAGLGLQLNEFEHVSIEASDMSI